MKEGNFKNKKFHFCHLIYFDITIADRVRLKHFDGFYADWTTYEQMRAAQQIGCITKDWKGTGEWQEKKTTAMKVSHP